MSNLIHRDMNGNVMHDIDLSYGSDVLRLKAEGVSKLLRGSEESILRRGKVDCGLLSTVDRVTYEAWLKLQDELAQ